MLTEREYRAMKAILTVTTDPEVKKLLRIKVGEHELEVTLRNISRRVRIIRNRVLRKGIDSKPAGEEL